jgi:hypothetical protein
VSTKSIPKTSIVRFLAQDGCLISFTGKLFYRVSVPADMLDVSPTGWIRVHLTPVARFGAYSPDPAAVSLYAEEYGKTGADPVFGIALYPTFNVLVDTGIIAVRGEVNFRQVTKYCPVTPESGCEVWLRDAAATTASSALDTGR